MPDWTAESEAAFDAYVDDLIGVIGHADRAEPLKDYCLGLLMPIERKSVEPLAAVTAPSRVSAKHQSLLHFVGQAPWSDAALLARVRDWVLPRIEQRGADTRCCDGDQPRNAGADTIEAASVSSTLRATMTIPLSIIRAEGDSDHPVYEIVATN
ncbi:transposase [Mesorhizobium sp. M0323]|uniref:transposase n=1 Tax=Mesorhizobium sp. M0323 TaxID=2956938 RepID=UPI00333DBE6D